MKPIEFRIIQQIKETTAENPFTTDKLRKWWAEYTGNSSPMSVSYPINRLLQMLIPILNPGQLEIFILSLNEDRNPYHTWSGIPFLHRDTNDFFLILLSRIVSVFINTKIADVPGYSEFLEKDNSQRVISLIEKADRITLQKEGLVYNVNWEIFDDKSLIVESIKDDTRALFGLDDLQKAQIGANGTITIGDYTLTLYTLTPMPL